MALPGPPLAHGTRPTCLLLLYYIVLNDDYGTLHIGWNSYGGAGG